jgi:hypothetical protein
MMKNIKEGDVVILASNEGIDLPDGHYFPRMTVGHIIKENVVPVFWSFGGEIKTTEIPSTCLRKV